jgi:hypothetical protein
MTFAFQIDSIGEACQRIRGAVAEDQLRAVLAFELIDGNTDWDYDEQGRTPFQFWADEVSAARRDLAAYRVPARPLALPSPRPVPSGKVEDVSSPPKRRSRKSNGESDDIGPPPDI